MIEVLTRTVYRSTTKGRSYLTKSAAITAEARALIVKKHPSEQADYDNIGRCTYGGFHWSSLPRSDVLFRRVRRLVLAGQSNASTSPPVCQG